MPPWATGICQSVGVCAGRAVGRRHPQRLPHLVVGGVGLAVAQVVGDRSGEQVAALWHQSDCRPQLLGVVVTNINVVDTYRPGRHVMSRQISVTSVDLPERWTRRRPL